MGKIKKTRGIRGQVIGSIVLLALASTAIMGILSLKIIEQKVLFSKIREAESLADLFSLPGGKGGADIKEFAKRAKRSGRISRFKILDARGETLLASGPFREVRGAKVLIERRGFTLSHSGQTRFSPLKGEFNAQLSLAGGRSIKFVVSLAGVREELRSIRWFIFYFALTACVVIIVFASYILSKVIFVPISRLEKTASMIAGGDLGVRAHEGGEGEVASLAASFNLMAESVEEKIKALESVNRELIGAQEKLIMTEKLATAGRFAAGIAHEIGNPLGAVQGYLEILIKGGTEEAEAEDILHRMSAEIERINAIVTDFLGITRKSKYDGSPCDVNRVVEDSLSMIKADHSFDGIEIGLKTADSMPGVVIDSSKLKQVFINILLNSADALQGRGRISIETTFRDASRVDLALPEGRRKTDQRKRAGESKLVLVSFTDNGPGISKEDKQKIFDPFFTTKDPGKGTGLGLFISEGILEAYRGWINVRSEEGAGTTFEVILEAFDR